MGFFIRDLDKAYGRLKTKETGETVYCVQEFKISCADEEYPKSNILEFSRTDEYRIRNIFLKNIDVTIDYSGSFDKDEVIHHLTTNEGFPVQDSALDEKHYMNNSNQVGNNCLTYMETVDGLTTPCKIYNKLVQILESKTVGQSWNDWVCQKDTRLAKARDLTKDHGLTRAEVTYYCKDTVPSDIVIKDSFKRITLSPFLVYSTPFADTWGAYCNALLHSLVVVDRTRDVGFIVCTYNEMAKNIRGQFVHGWALMEKWYLANLTFSSKLPMDIIEVYDRSKATSGKTKDTFVDISGARYFKTRIDDSIDFPTYLLSKGCWYEESKEGEHLQQLEKAGFVPHKHCTPLFAYLQCRGNRQEEIELRRTDILGVKVPGKHSRATKKEQNEHWKDVAEQATKSRKSIAKKKRSVIKVLNVKPVEHKGQKRKLVLTEDGIVYKVKRLKLEDTVKPGQYV